MTRRAPDPTPEPPHPKRTFEDTMEEEEEDDDIDDSDVPKYADILAPILSAQPSHKDRYGGRSGIVLGIC